MKFRTCHFLAKMGLLSALSFAVASSSALATLINFETQPTGPTSFLLTTPGPQTVVTNNTTFTGGSILTGAVHLPADETTVYGSADFGTGLLNPLKFSNPSGFLNLSFNIINGEGLPQSFLVKDNAGHSTEYDNVASNINSGIVVAAFATAGTQITITDISNPGTWDFMVDNVSYDVPTPQSLTVPDGASTLGLLGVGLAGLAWAGRKLRGRVVG